MPMNSIERVQYIITNTSHLTLATADAEGNPWSSPVFFAPDANYNLYWVSSKDAIHSHNIAVRRRIGLSIIGDMPDGTRDGVYYKADAHELSDTSEISVAIAALARRPQPTKFMVQSDRDVLGEANWRIYQAAPLEIYKRRDAEIDGQAVTVREPIPLETLRGLATG